MSIVGDIGLALLVVLRAIGAVEFMIFRAGQTDSSCHEISLSSWAPAARASGRLWGRRGYSVFRASRSLRSIAPDPPLVLCAIVSLVESAAFRAMNQITGSQIAVACCSTGLSRRGLAKRAGACWQTIIKNWELAGDAPPRATEPLSGPRGRGTRG
jgi:hypothetical protein